MRMPCACLSLMDRPPQPCRIAHSRIERCNPTTCQIHEPAGLPRPVSGLSGFPAQALGPLDKTGCRCHMSPLARSGLGCFSIARVDNARYARLSGRRAEASLFRRKRAVRDSVRSALSKVSTDNAGEALDSRRLRLFGLKADTQAHPRLPSPLGGLFTSWLRHDVVRPPGLFEPRLQWSVEAQDGEPRLARNSLHPIAALPW